MFSFCDDHLFVVEVSEAPLEVKEPSFRSEGGLSGNML